ncbi:DNA helicase RecQ [Methanoplanus sp. FWC-SCC4]|uniref:DNA 3'-5' helicase n=1 Tax=Methanochimaera problematica TaxID=2609417 RepID=A0AA97I319_9EURY|nr:DNA helicase RecQ [Methanoplanus sp. FWC-SCC4]WOF16890.1 DNA helicase RecQ [Methanoplanus sp. FWC-SCC4]
MTVTPENSDDKITTAKYYLRKYFGYSSFHPYQEEIIRNILTGRDVFAVIATGGGKSICYQLPAVMMKGTAVIISPLIALMKDQVDGLLANGIPAGCLNSTQDYSEYLMTVSRLKSGKLDILYVSPEKAVTPSFRALLKQFDVSLFAVDEAHCISQWGHEFRPEYRKLSILKKEFPKIPVIALTATATSVVRDDILKQLRLKLPYTYVGTFFRENLHYQVLPKKDAFGQILAYIKDHPRDSGIIYCNSRNSAESLSKKLNLANVPALPYHAGLSKKIREKTQDKFIKDDIPVIVATVAFGMGINKPDVRFVIHYDLSQSPEAYYQETGRAGRDGGRGDCILFYSRGDRAKIQYFIDKLDSRTLRGVAEKKLEAMTEYCESNSCRFKTLLEYFGETNSDFRCGVCDNCINPRELFDGTEPAKTAIKCIEMLKQPFGIGYIADILWGSSSARVKERGHDKLPLYGKGRMYKKDEWNSFLREMVHLGYLSREGRKYPVIVLNETSADVVSGKITVYLTRPKGVKPGSKKAEAVYNTALYETLKRLRKIVAESENIPPYQIFSDAVLAVMAEKMPLTPAEMLSIKGVGEYKVEKFGATFLRRIKDFQKIPVNQEKNQGVLEKSPKSSVQTYDLYCRGYTVKQIAEERSLTEDIVCVHLEEMIKSGAAIDLSDLVSSKKRDLVYSVLSDNFDIPVRDIRILLGEAVSYNEIRLIKAFWDKKNPGKN